MNLKKKLSGQVWLLILLFIFLLFDFLILIYISIILIKSPENSAPFNAGNRNANGEWDGEPLSSDIVNTYYPKSFGFWDASYRNQTALYWLNSSGIIAIVLCSLCVLNYGITFLFINPKIKSRFRSSLFNNISLILCMVLIIDLILGLGDVPQHFNDSYNKGWQWFDDGRKLDVDWKNWFFNHDVKRDTIFGSENDAVYNKMYELNDIGIIFITFNFIVISLTTIMSLFGIVLAISRYRSWKRYHRIDIESVDIGLL